MIRTEALSQLRLVVGAARTPLVASERDLELPALSPGQPINGRVEQQTRAGYIVSVRGRSFDVKLPDGTRPGDLLRMVYVNDNPRPTFILLRIEHPNNQAGSELSGAGKLLAGLADIQFESPGKAAAGSTVPVFASRVPEGAQAATLLREAFGLSGLFYESHQAQWVLGTRSRAQLQREPQGKLVPMQPAAQESAQFQAFPGPKETISGMQAMPSGITPGKQADSAPQPEQIARSPAHQDSYPIIRQQLSALETGQVTWHGTIWPGQLMQWQVADDASGERDGREMPRTWSTELKLTLPNIGELHARIELGANGAKLRITADSEQHALQLREQAPALAMGFSASGIPVNALEVSHGSESA